ncbi:MAG: serine--tRNA ligase [Gammaproteobacteria bacterium]|nr:serine--tRNA ligase [Gammaproteobacteria bacterium]
MLDPRYLRRNIREVAERLAIKGFELDQKFIEDKEIQRKKIQLETERLQAERNLNSKKIGKLKSKGDPVGELLKQVASIGAQLDESKIELEKIQNELNDYYMNIPNIPDISVPPGDSEDDNVEIRKWGEAQRAEFNQKDHVDLTSKSNSLSFDDAAKISGSRFAIMRGPLARMHRALVHFMLDIHTKEHGYEEVYVPYIVNKDSLKGTGQLPKFEEDLFKIDGDREFYLIPTAEVPVTNILRDKIVEAAELPVKYVCHTPCFRSEAGSYGRDTKGMIRQHQFEKVELVMVTRPIDSEQAHEELTSHAEQVLKRLNLPYRVVNLCGKDLGFASAKTYDLEVWLPGQGVYREISSCSNFLDFQARRISGRWRQTSSSKPDLFHTLNGSGLAVGRTLVAILENYQNKDGSLSIPEALRHYMDGEEQISLA